jgi:hypothetical protein
MAKKGKSKEVAGRLVLEFIKIWLCNKAYRLPKNQKVLEVLEKSKSDFEALKSL